MALRRPGLRVSFAIHAVVLVLLIVTVDSPAPNTRSVPTFSASFTNPAVDAPVFDAIEDLQALPEHTPIDAFEQVPVDDASDAAFTSELTALDEGPSTSLRKPFTLLDLPSTAFRRHRASAPRPSMKLPAATLAPPARRPDGAARRAPSRPSPSPLRIMHAPNVQRFYPDAGIRRGLQGTVVVLLWIDEHGLVQRVTVERSSGYDTLDNAALTLAGAYRFSAGTGWRRTRLPITFRIPVSGS